MAKAKKTSYYSLNKNFLARDTRSAGSHEYTLEAAQKLVMWTRMLSTGPVDRGPNSLTPAYENTPNFSEVQLGNKIYPAAQFNDTGEDSAYVTSTSGLLSFSSLASGGTPTATSDQPFSISCWINIDNITTLQYIFGKSGGSSDANEYRAYVYTNGKVYFKLKDEDSSGYQQIISAAAITIGEWNHLVFTYDGSGGATAYDGMKMYLNGALFASAGSGDATYVGMQPDHTKPLYMGSQQDGTDEMDGWMAEFAVWSKELTADEVAAVHYGTEYGSNELISGFLDNPPRILLHANDNRTGSYPTVARTGDPNFTGRGGVQFNDMKTVEFFSSYATAEIKFSDIPKDASTINVTGSLGNTKVTFEFQRGVHQSYKGAIASTLVNIRGKQTTSTVAYEFAKQVNDSSLNYEARAVGNTVKLRSHIPGPLISSDPLLTFTRRFRDTSVKLTQFTQNGPTNYNYPMLLPEATPRDIASGSTHIFDNIAFPNTSGTLNAPAIMVAGISDYGIHFTPGENLGPFDESRIFIDAESPFYMTGTNPSILPGFSQRLSSKTSFKIDISATGSTQVGFSTGSNTSGIERNQGRPSPRHKDASTVVDFNALGVGTVYFTLHLSGGDPYDGPNISEVYLFGSEKKGPAGGVQGTFYAGDSTTWTGYSNESNISSSCRDAAQIISSYSEYFDAGVHENNLIIWNHHQTTSQNGNFSYKVIADDSVTVVTQSVWSGQNSGEINSPINSGLAYFNFNDRKWDVINQDYRHNFSGSMINYISKEFQDITASNLAVIPPRWFTTSLTAVDFFESNRYVGTPCNTAQFPLGDQFEASNNQVIEMSKYITAPFLCEKIVFDVTASLSQCRIRKVTSGTPWIAEQPQTQTFMVLLQRDLKFSGSLNDPATFKYWAGSGYPPMTNKPEYATYSQDRRIIWWGRVAQYADYPAVGVIAGWPTFEEFASEYPWVTQAAEKWIGVGQYQSSDPVDQSTTGSFRIENECRTPLEAPFSQPPAQYISYPPSAGATGHQRDGGVVYGRSTGGRSLHNLSDGRSFIRGTSGTEILEKSGSYRNVKAPFGNGPDRNEFPVNISKDTSRVSPFLLMPADKLIILFANQAAPWTYRTTAAALGTWKWETERGLSQECSTVLGAGSAGVTFFGTEVRENSPVSFETNQPLTSDALHEDVRDDMSPYGEARCLDQWQVEPISSYYGSYLDNVVTGSMYDLSDPTKFVNPSPPGHNDLVANVRKVQASVVAGQGGITGSLQRFVRATDSARVYYDSCTPNMGEVIEKRGLAFYSFSVSTNTLQSLILDAGSTPDKQVMGFPFESDISDITRKPIVRDIFSKPGIQSVGNASVSFTAGGIRSPNNSWGPVYKSSAKVTYGEDYSNSKVLSSETDLLKVIWGIGDAAHNAAFTGKGVVDWNTSGTTLGNVFQPNVRGWKYGLINAAPISPTAIFRCDAYGQFRDMLEPTLTTRFFDNQILGEPVIEVNFTSRAGELGISPDSTNSQNLSQFATSSLPYFDGLSKSRPGTQPDLLDKIQVG